MKIRNHRKREYWFRPSENSKLKKHLYRFKYMQDLMKFLNNNLEESINGTVDQEEQSFNHSGCRRSWFVWYNDHAPRTAKLKIELRQLYFRGRKFICKTHTISKSSKRFYAFSEKVISLMSHIEDDNGKILHKDAEKLISLFYKRGFKDFEPNEEDWTYINGHISDGIQFSYWSDRCNHLRMKTIFEYFKREKLIKS